MEMAWEHSHAVLAATEFYRAKNLGWEAGSIQRAEIWVCKHIRQSEEQLAEWEAYLNANESYETANTKFEAEARRNQIEKRKVAAAKELW
jgi:hypothetical protein